MKNVIILLAMTGALAACEEPFGGTQTSDQDSAANAVGSVVDDVESNNRTQNQDRDHNQGGN